MPNLERRGKRWRVRVMVDGRKASATFHTKGEAAAWALAQHKGMAERRDQHTLKDALKKYAREVAPDHKGKRWELVRLKSLQDDPVAAWPLLSLGPPQLAEWRDRRLWKVKGSTVLREMNLLGSVLESARREWRWIGVNPIKDVRKPPQPPGRRRRIAQEEIEAIAAACGLADGLRAQTALQRVGLAFLFAVETAMRAGEILGLTAADIHLAEKYVRLPRTKNGDVREVPLSSRAVAILKTLPGNVFDLNPQSRDVFFRRAREAAQIQNLHFHDARAEAIWRLSKKFNILELARIIGHRDLKSLMLYYQDSASELATRLD